MSEDNAIAGNDKKPPRTELGERINGFIGQLTRWKKNEQRAELAALRQSLGGDKLRAARYVMPYLGEDSDESNEYFYLIGGLFAWHPEHRNGVSFAQAMKQLKDDGASESTIARFMALLACNENELETHLRQCVGILRAHEVGFDYHKLLRDLSTGRGWKHPRRRVQESWACEFNKRSRKAESTN